MTQLASAVKDLLVLAAIPPPHAPPHPLYLTASRPHPSLFNFSLPFPTGSPSVPPQLVLLTLLKLFVSSSGSALCPVCVCLAPPHQLLTKQILGSLNLIIKYLYLYHIGLFCVFFLEVNFIYFVIVSVCEGFPPHLKNQSKIYIE